MAAEPPPWPGSRPSRKRPRARWPPSKSRALTTSMRRPCEQTSRRGKPGLPLQLRIQLVDSKRCEPIENAAVDIWHCDALGVYSGFVKNNPDGPPGGGPGLGGPPPQFDARDSGRRSPAGGCVRVPSIPPGFCAASRSRTRPSRVEFATLYPGWYSGRAIHIHLKVHVGGHVSHTGQLFFPEEITSDIAKLEPCATRLRVHRTLQTEDHIFTDQHGAGSLLTLRAGKRHERGRVSRHNDASVESR